MWTFSKLQAKKTSDTVFVLGAGRSINRVDNWEEIETNDSIGINFFLAHNFSPTFISIELPNNPQQKEGLRRLVRSKPRSYWDKTYVLVKRPFWRVREVDLEFLKIFGLTTANFNFVRTRCFGAKSIDNLLKSTTRDMAHVKKWGGPFFFGQGVASIETLCSMLVYLGYKKIVFVGVDLNNNDYFYESTEYNFLKEAGVKLTAGQQERVHKTNDPINAWGSLTVIQVLRAYERYYQSYGVEFFCSSKESTLAQYFPLWRNRAAEKATSEIK